MLLAAAKLANRLHVDSEGALRAAAAKFRRRFAAMEQALREQGRGFHDLGVPEKEALWRAAKDNDKMTG
jgi:uncharacterized protein YabN with tetrapyrrole methylase and pyrophosphatase domain